MDQISQTANVLQIMTAVITRTANTMRILQSPAESAGLPTTDLRRVSRMEDEPRSGSQPLHRNTNLQFLRSCLPLSIPLLKYYQLRAYPQDGVNSYYPQRPRDLYQGRHQ